MHISQGINTQSQILHLRYYEHTKSFIQKNIPKQSLYQTGINYNLRYYLSLAVTPT